MEQEAKIASLMDVFQIYSSGPEPGPDVGLHMGGLDVGMDLSQNPLHVSFEAKENLVEKLKSPFPNPYGSYAESLQQDFRIPSCYKLAKPKELTEEMIKNVLPVSVLMYIFYNMPNEKA